MRVPRSTAAGCPRMTDLIVPPWRSCALHARRPRQTASSLTLPTALRARNEHGTRMADGSPSRLPTAAIADAAVRLGVELGVAPPSVVRLVAGPPVVGRALPCRHSGSVDVFLEA